MLFLGLLFEKGEEQIIASKSKDGFLQNQVNSFQWSCIDGLYENGVSALTIVNALPVGAFPRMYADAVIPSKVWRYNGALHYQLGSLNIPFFKQEGRFRAAKKLIKRLSDKHILIYSAYSPFLKAVHKLDKSYNITLIVPDLPEYYDYSNVGAVKRLFRKLNNRSVYKYMKRIDRFVLLTEEMKGPLNVGDRPYAVVDGFCPPSSQYVREKPYDKKIILYTGSVNKSFGIDVLLEAFELISDDGYELWICGGGDYQDMIKSAAERDPRIKFFGFVTRDKASELQSKATVLVNPRQNIGEFTKYSFPSKTMEYLLSGVPVVAYKLDGMSDEYDKFINYVSDNTPTALSEALVQVCDDTCGLYEKTAKDAKEFIITHKDPKTQAEKIMELVFK